MSVHLKKELTLKFIHSLKGQDQNPLGGHFRFAVKGTYCLCLNTFPSFPSPLAGEGAGEGGVLRNAIAISGATKMFVLKYNSLDSTKYCGNLSISDNISHIRGRRCLNEEKIV